MLAFAPSFWVDFAGWWASVNKGEDGSWVFVYLLLSFIIIYGLDSALGRPIHKGLEKFGKGIQWVVEHIILTGLLFYGIFTPLAFFFRLIGRDVMKVKIDKKAKTHWIEKEKQNLKPEDYERSG